MLSGQQSRPAGSDKGPENDGRRRGVRRGQGVGQGRAGTDQTAAGGTGVRTELEIHIENRFGAERQGQRLAVDGGVPGDHELHELLRRRVAQPSVRVDRRSLFQSVRIALHRRNVLFAVA